MISKELLSEVLEDEYNDRLVDWFQIEDNYLRTYYDCGRYDYEGRPTGLGIEINIYELAQKCKEWAYKQGYVILSGHSAYGIGAFFCSCKGWLSENYDKRIEINHNTEPEAIFQACQWILDNRN